MAPKSSISSEERKNRPAQKHQQHHEVDGSDTLIKRRLGKFRRDDRLRIQRVRPATLERTKSTSFWNLSLLYAMDPDQQEAVHDHISEMAQMVGSERITAEEALNAITSIRFKLMEFEDFKERMSGRLGVTPFGWELDNCEKQRRAVEIELRAHVCKVDEYLQSIKK